MSKEEKVELLGVAVDCCIGWAAGAFHVAVIDPVCDSKLSKLTALLGTCAVSWGVARKVRREIYTVSDEYFGTNCRECLKQ